MLYRKILTIIEENSEFDGQDGNLIKDNSFHKLAEDLNALFVLNSSSLTLPSRGDMFSEADYSSEKMNKGNTKNEKACFKLGFYDCYRWLRQELMK